VGKENLNSEFRRCVERGKIITFRKGPSLVVKELNSAADDLLASKDSFEKGGYKWATIQAYYSMFHTARGLIYAKKYREKSHYCLVIALEHLYVERGVLDKVFIESLTMGKDMRESADYRSNFSEEGAHNLIKAAQDFLNIAKKLVKSRLSRPQEH